MKDKFTVTQIKKLTYKQQPKAKFEKIRMGSAYYTFKILFESEKNSYRLGFEVIIPISDMGEADFFNEMEAKLLLRWVSEDVIKSVVYLETIKEEL